MKIVSLILLTMFFSCISSISEKIDSVKLNERLSLLTVRIENDSQFNDYLAKEYGTVTSFLFNDTLTRVLLPHETIIKIYKNILYKDSSVDFIKEKYRFWKDNSIYPYKYPILLPLNNIFKNHLSNYKIYIDILENNNLLVFLVFPITTETNTKTLYGHCLFDRSNNILDFRIEPLIIK